MRNNLAAFMNQQKISVPGTIYTETKRVQQTKMFQVLLFSKQLLIKKIRIIDIKCNLNVNSISEYFCVRSFEIFKKYCLPSLKLNQR